MANIPNPTSERSQVKTLSKMIYEGKTNTDKLKEQDIELYLMNKQVLDTAQRLFINDKLEPVKWRLNLIFIGDGGTGKTTLANLIAEKLKVKVFTFTDIDSGLLDYLNEDCIIWDEMRSYLIKEWGINRFLSATNNGRYNTARINVKYGAVKIAQHYNFITTSESPRNFLTGLTDRTYTDYTKTVLAEPENPEQITRRYKTFFEFSKKALDKENYKIEININSYNPIREDNGTYTFFDKYEKLKTWTFEANEDNYFLKLEKLAEAIANNITEHKLDIETLINTDIVL